MCFSKQWGNELQKNILLDGAQCWKQQEKIGNTTQEKQVDRVKKKRTLGDGKVLPWGSIVVLKYDNGSKWLLLP